MDLVDFLRARLDEEAAIARTLGGEAWADTGMDVSLADDTSEIVASGRMYGDLFESLSADQRAHIARQDPARALAEIEAKRVLVDDYTKEAWVMEQGHRTGWTEGGQSVRKQLVRAWAASHRDHPDFDPSWLED